MALLTKFTIFFINASTYTNVTNKINYTRERLNTRMSNMSAVKPVTLSLHYKARCTSWKQECKNSAIHLVPGNNIGLMAENSTQWEESERN